MFHSLRRLHLHLDGRQGNDTMSHFGSFRNIAELSISTGMHSDSATKTLKDLLGHLAPSLRCAEFNFHGHHSQSMHLEDCFPRVEALISQALSSCSLRSLSIVTTCNMPSLGALLPAQLETLVVESTRSSLRPVFVALGEGLRLKLLRCVPLLTNKTAEADRYRARLTKGQVDRAIEGLMSKNHLAVSSEQRKKWYGWVNAVRE